jgi:tungstate transport system permease protein
MLPEAVIASLPVNSLLSADRLRFNWPRVLPAVSSAARRRAELRSCVGNFDAGRLALGLLLYPDAALLQIIFLSLIVSVSASTAAVGLPLGAALAVFRFRGRVLLITLANALLGLPPVVVGLALYLVLSRSGPLGFLGILFTPAAMVIAQFLLALPIIVALSHRAMEGIWKDYGDDLLVSGASRPLTIPYLLSIGRKESLTAGLAGFGELFPRSEPY